MLAALHLHQEWGVDDLIEDHSWDVWEERSIQRDPPPKGQPIVMAAPARENVKGAEDVLAALATAQDVETLKQVSQHIPGITLARTAKHHLAPVLVKDAPFLLIGDVPNEDEDRHGTLFAGEMGVLLGRILASIGLKRDQLSMAPAIPWRPPGGQRASQRELELCLPVLQRIVALAKPQRIVTMGTIPAGMLLHQEGPRLSQLRGRWHEAMIPGFAQPIPLLPLWHPAQLGDNAGRRRHLWHDLLLLEASLQKGNEGED
ncbi:uracil-DNA glycosylase [Bombella saccharophila]|uniref:Uracil-DNA glycosylase n=1 Tax=Bombella saccharophila TaxID=2967338 RepID=A0ABT3W9D4_9PROT|nr:uracil-DNA glycosylase [Bombella saccharophila]MCX5615004.1 uracil-DNA glycosylase [Bombella saccharophila]